MSNASIAIQRLIGEFYDSRPQQAYPENGQARDDIGYDVSGVAGLAPVVTRTPFVLTKPAGATSSFAVDGAEFDVPVGVQISIVN
jgi:hypothetical protein